MADELVVAERGVLTASVEEWDRAARRAEVIKELADQRVVGLIGSRGARIPLVLGGALLAIGGFLLVPLAVHTSVVYLLMTYAVFGFGAGLVAPAVSNTAVSGLPADQAGVASALASSARQFGIAVGVAITGSMVTGTGTGFHQIQAHRLGHPRRLRSPRAPAGCHRHQCLGPRRGSQKRRTARRADQRQNPRRRARRADLATQGVIGMPLTTLDPKPAFIAIDLQRDMEHAPSCTTSATSPHEPDSLRPAFRQHELSVVLVNVTGQGTRG